jgi:hypothetical protein
MSWWGLGDPINNRRPSHRQPRHLPDRLAPILLYLPGRTESLKLFLLFALFALFSWCLGVEVLVHGKVYS